MEPVLVTGGAGFIGSNIAESLLLRGCRVVVLDDLSVGSSENILQLSAYEKFKFVKGSVLDSGLLRAIIKTENISAISHNAAQVGVAGSFVDPVKTLNINIAGTANVFYLAAEYGCRRVVYATSLCAAAENHTGETKDFSPYAVSKMSQEMLAEVFSEVYRMEIVGIRYPPVYGRRQNADSDYAGEIPEFIAKALLNQPICLKDDGKESCDFIYIDDAVEAAVSALFQEDATSGVFNVASGKQTTQRELAELIVKLAGSHSPIVFRPAMPAAPPKTRPAPKLFQTVSNTQYPIRYEIARGLTETVSWHQRRGKNPCAA